MAALPPGETPPETLVRALRAGEWFAVIPHRLPDVDALATAAALCRILRASGRAAAVFAPEVPAIYGWALPGELRAAGEPPAAAVRVAVDTARPDRLQCPGPVDLSVDHHEDNPGFGRVADWVAPAPSCTCLLPALAAALGVPVDGPLATLLHAGLVGDTECFRVNLSPAAFRWAAWLAAQGADCEGTAEAFCRRSPGFWAYLAAVEGGGRELPGPPPLRIVPIPASWPERFGLLPYENALLPAHLAPPAGGVLAILQEGRSGVRFRLRSRGVDVLPLAHRLGGGGHPQAAGVVVPGADLAAAEALLLRAARVLGAAAEA
jgi:phosphoesterase RecJ-like protein